MKATQKKLIYTVTSVLWRTR